MSRIFQPRSAVPWPFPGSICAVVLLLAGCAQPAAQLAALAPRTAAIAPTDPVLRAVAAAAVNIPVSVTIAADATPATLIVTADYISAQGQECRAYTLAGAPNLACTDGTSWREIPPLAPSDNPGSPP